MADHFQYQAAIALITLVAAGLTLLGRALPKPVAATAGALLLVPLAAVAHERTHVYKNLETLYLDVLAVNPASWIAHINLADYLDHLNRVDDAIPHYRAGLEHMTKANWHNGDLSRALELTGQLDDAIAQYQQDLAEEMSDGEKSEVHRRLADVLERAGRDDEAIKHYENALELNDKNPLTMSSLGQVLLDNQDTDAGIEMLRKSIELNPNNALAQQRLGIALRKQGSVDDALQALAISAQLNPNNAKTREELATVLLLKGDAANAASQLQLALALDQKYAGAHNLHGMLLAQQGKLDLAGKEFELALQLDPENEAAKSNLAKLREFLEQQQAAPASPAVGPTEGTAPAAPNAAIENKPAEPGGEPPAVPPSEPAAPTPAPPTAPDAPPETPAGDAVPKS